MTGLDLHVDAPLWREGVRTTASARPGLVAVAKGNGYGFGLARLAREAEHLRRAGLCDALAVGMVAELAEVREHFGGDLVVLTPWRAEEPGAIAAARDPRVVITVARLHDFEVLANLDRRPRVLVEVQTSMRRHGLTNADLAGVRAWTEFVDVAGWTIHLPMPAGGANLAEARHLAQLATDTLPAPLWVSHLSAEEAADLGERVRQPVLQRLGTHLWLGTPGSPQARARRITSTVLDVHPARRGDAAGYHRRRLPADGAIVVVAGGTAHGVGLAAPTPADSLRQRAIALASGGLEAAGFARSPFSIAGRKRFFLEPPHMQSSLLFLPRSVPAPSVGDTVDVELRMTTSSFDTIDLAPAPESEGPSQ